MSTTDTPRRPSDAPHLSPVTPEEDARTILMNEVNWGAVFAGVALALTVQLILNMLGVAVGAATVNPMASDNPSIAAFSIGAGLWWAVAGIIAAFAGGIAAGRLAGTPKESTAGWHGLISWAFTTLLVFYLVTATATNVASTAAQGVSSAVGGVAQTAGGAVQTAAQAAAPALAQTADPFSSIERSIRGGGQDPAALRDAAVSAMRAFVTADPGQAQAARDRAADALAKAQNIPIDQARNQVQQYEAQYRQAVDTARQQATQTAETARRTLSRGSLLAAIALLIGALAAWFGGRMGAVDPTLTTEHRDITATRNMPERRT